MSEEHEFNEDVNDASMCTCGIPALTHDLVYAYQDADLDPDVPHLLAEARKVTP